MNCNRRNALQALAAAGAAWAVPGAQAQAATARILVGFPPGGLPDMVARAIAEPIGQALGVAAVVDNRPGANGRIAAQAVKNAAPDGRTVLLCPASAMVHLPHVYKDLGYDPFTDFVPVAQVVENDFAFAISPKIPARDLKEFAAWCRANPQAATYGTPGPGSLPHFMGVALAKALGVTLNHIPYKGTNFAITDLGGGHIAAMISSSTFVVTPHQNGQVRVLGVTGRQRLPALPDVPTFLEQGITPLNITDGTWVMAPAKTPQAMVDKLAEAVISSLQGREMKQVTSGQAQAAPLRPAALRERMRQEFDQRGSYIRAAGFSATQS